jgi:DNA replication licensing factor MCM5
MLSSHFVALRKQVQQVEKDNEERSSIPITIRYADRSMKL